MLDTTLSFIFTYCSGINENLQSACDLWMEPCAVCGQEKKRNAIDKIRQLPPLYLSKSD